MKVTLLSFTPAPVMAAVLALASASPAAAVELLTGGTRAWTYSHATDSGFLSEIVAFDNSTGHLWVAGVSGVDVLNAATGSLVSRIDTRAYGSVNSVAIHNGLAALAVESSSRTSPGQVLLFDTATRALAGGTNSITVGALPDMLTFTPDGSRLLVANEASPSTYGARLADSGGHRNYDSSALDPAGSVSIISMASRTVSATATLAGVAHSGGLVRTNTGMDFEPEYIAVNAAGTRAYVSLQEANAMGVLNLQTQQFERVVGLGAKDFNAPGNAIDPLNNSTISFANVAAKGLYMPDGMAAYEAGGKTYVVMANEGDFREDDADRSAASSFGASGVLANLRVSNTDSSAPASGGELYAAGARSFSIRDEDGNLVFDSGNTLDTMAAAATVGGVSLYNDGRSRDKGVEPEGVELMTLGGQTYAFVGLERTTNAAVGVFNITNPAQASFVTLLVSDGDVSPEGLKGYSLGGRHYLAFSNEVSNTTTVFQLSAVPEPATYGMLALGLAVVGAAAKRRCVSAK